VASPNSRDYSPVASASNPKRTKKGGQPDESRHTTCNKCPGRQSRSWLLQDSYACLQRLQKGKAKGSDKQGQYPGANNFPNATAS